MLKENALVNNLSESTLLLLPLLHFIHFLFHLFLHASHVYPTTHNLSLSPSLSFFPLSSSHRPTCGGVVPCTRTQPETGGPEGDAECWSRVGSWSGRLPPQWRSYSTQGLPGRAARTSAHTQALSCSPEDWRWLLTLIHTLLPLRLSLFSAYSFFWLIFLCAVTRPDPLWWERGQDRYSWQGSSDWSISAAFHAAASSQPQSSEAATWPAASHRPQSAR